MPNYKILGIYSYADNLKKVKINDSVILKNEKFNIKSENAIGVYTIDNKKLGYLPIEKSLETQYFKNSYQISKISLNSDYPILEINRYYSPIGYIENVEYPYIKEIKYEMKLVKPHEKTEKALIGLINYFKTKKIKIKKLGITYQDEFYINIIIETSKGRDFYYTVTNEYFNLNSDKYDELFENELIDNTFYRDFLFHRLECYFESNYERIEHNIYNFSIDNIKTNIIHEETNIDSLKAILYLRYLIDNNDEYIIKKYNIIDTNIINKIKIIYDLYLNINLGKFYYDHNLKLYEYIKFLSDDYLIDIVDLDEKNNYQEKINNIIMKAKLCCKDNICVYNPSKGIIYIVNNILSN